MTRASTITLLLVLASLVPACTGRTGEGRPFVPGNGVDGGGGPTGDADGSLAPRLDAMVRDPFDPASGCGSASIPTERVPGSLLLVFDRSSSMNETPDGMQPRAGEPTKWDLSERAIGDAMSSVSGDLSMGLLLFPTGEGDICDVTLSPGVPHVDIGPLSTTRSQIASRLASGPNGGNTPIYDAVQAGYAYLDTLTTEGQRGLVVVTDGAENCDEGDREAVLSEAQMRHDRDGYLTFAIGLDNADAFLSTIALNGGTRRNDTCMGQCVAPTTTCSASMPCPGGAPCLLGFCVDTSTTEPDCCHYDVASDDFEAQFNAALDEIAERFLDSCVFRLPRGADPSTFDHRLVNVGVTFEGEERTVLRRGEDPSVDSWNFTETRDYESIVIQGAICDRLLDGSATVEIVLGCPTILI